MEVTTPLTDFFRVVRQGWLIILVCVVVGIGGAFAASKLIPQKYEAVAVLTVEPLTGTPGSSGSVDMETERVVAGSTSVLSKAAQELGDRSVEVIQDAVVVTIPKGSRVLEFTYTASTPTEASDGANAVANAYSDQRTESAQKAVDDTTESLSKRIAQLEQQLASEQAGSVAARAVELQISSLQERQATATSATFSAGTLVSPATPPTSTSGLGALVFAAAGFALGLLTGLLLALIRYRVGLERRAVLHAAEAAQWLRVDGNERSGLISPQSVTAHADEAGRSYGAHAEPPEPGNWPAVRYGSTPWALENGPDVERRNQQHAGDDQVRESERLSRSLRLGPKRQASGN